jgi:transposase
MKERAGEQLAPAFLNDRGRLCDWSRPTHAPVNHVMVDNYGIHTSGLARWALRCAGGQSKLHLLPPYSPQDKPTDRVWEDLHANVTRNHTCKDLSQLARHACNDLRRRLRQSRRRCQAAPASAAPMSHHRAR